MDDARKQEVARELFGAMLDRVVSKSAGLPGYGTLADDIQKLADEAELPVEEVVELLEDHFGQPEYDYLKAIFAVGATAITHQDH